MLAPKGFFVFSCFFIGLSRAATCPTDVASVSDGSFTPCTYQNSSSGAFSSGSSTAISSTSSNGGGSNCPPTDDANSPLTSSSIDGTFIVCTYQIARRCEYFPIGEFSSGSSDCPDSIPAQGYLTSASDTFTSDTPTDTTSASTPTSSSQPSVTPATPSGNNTSTPASSGASASNTSSALPRVSFWGGVLALAAAVLGLSLL